MYCFNTNGLFPQTIYHINQNMNQIDRENHRKSLRNRITLTNSELYELAYNHQKFMAVVRKFNDQAKNKIQSEAPQDALIYLAEAQRVLEYAASCGKNIDRNLIISILHNEACCYQKTWDLEKCSNYVQALIYNFHQNLQSCHTTPFSAESPYKSNNSISYDYMGQIEKKSWNFRLQLSKYELQFCAISSQLRNHKTALKSGLKGIKILKSIFTELMQVAKDYFLPFNKQQFKGDPDSEQTYEEIRAKIKVIEGITGIDDEPKLGKLQDYYITAKYYLNKWNVRKMSKSSEIIRQNLKNFSIGNIMQLKPLSFEQNRESTIDLEKWLENAYEEKSKTEMFRAQTYEKILLKVLLLSMSYFTVATEMRLLSSQKFQLEEIRRQSKQFKQSQIYHLIALILPTIYVPFDMLYIRHILASFNNHNSMTLDSSITIPETYQHRIMKVEFDPFGVVESKNNLGIQQSKIMIEKNGNEEQRKQKMSKSKSNSKNKIHRVGSIQQRNKSKSKKFLSHRSSNKNSMRSSRERKKSQKKQLSSSKQKNKNSLLIKNINKSKEKKPREQYFIANNRKGNVRKPDHSNNKNSVKCLKSTRRLATCTEDSRGKQKKKPTEVKTSYKKNIDSYYF